MCARAIYLETGARTHRVRQLECTLAPEMDPLSKFFSFFYLNIKIRMRIMQNDKEKKTSWMAAGAAR